MKETAKQRAARKAREHKWQEERTSYSFYNVLLNILGVSVGITTLILVWLARG